MTQVVVAASHKGGTGRSVTMANVATRLALKGKNVCIVDLDLASPTFGTVAGLKSIPAGVEAWGTAQAPKSIHDLLKACIDGDRQAYRNVCRGLIDVWTGEPFKGAALGAAKGKLQLLPGKRLGGDGYTAEEMAGVIRNVIEEVVIAAPADIVICDLRSGISEPFQAFSLPEFGLQDIVAAYVFHFRWTPQQLNGLSDMLSPQVREGLPLEKVRFIKTAVQTTTAFQDRTDFVNWLDRGDGELKSQFAGILEAINASEEDAVLGEVPLDPLLQWRETIITDALVDKGVALPQTVEAFESISERINELVH